MLKNPFTPSNIAIEPNDFFGREAEVTALRRSLSQGSVIIQGPMGIGKSSLLAHGRLIMEGYGSDAKSRSFLAVGDKSVRTIDDAARIMLEAFVQVDQQKKTVKFILPKVFEFQSEELCTFFAQNRHLAVLKRLVEAEYLNLMLNEGDFLLLCMDEADKCPIPIAQLVRSVITHAQQNGRNRVRFILAGVSPFFQSMLVEDAGISRFFYKTITLEPMSLEDATELVEVKLRSLVQDADHVGIPLRVDSTVVQRIVRLSGGHPHILQLLGSQLVEHENDDPDGVLDAHDLANSLRRICYEDRRPVYDALIHEMEARGILDGVQGVLTIASSNFPTHFSRTRAQEHLSPETLQWLVERNIIYTLDQSTYGLTDEFLRIRLHLDAVEAEAERRSIERKVLKHGVWPGTEDAMFDEEDERGDDENDGEEEDRLS